MSTENLTPLSLEIHFRTADHFTEREGPGVSCKEDQTPLICLFFKCQIAIVAV